MIDLKRAYQRGFVYTGQYSSFRQRGHGTDPTGVKASQFVVCSQNHDQIGNRAIGDRLSDRLSLEQLKLAAASTILSPFLPLLFMGEEYGEEAPFQYFTSHSEPKLVEAVREGRAAEFSAFGWSDDVPDPQAPETFDRSKLRPEYRDTPRGKTLEAFYRELIRLRRTLPAFEAPAFSRLNVELSGNEERLLALERRQGDHVALTLFNYSSGAEQCRLPSNGTAWKPILDSSDHRWSGPGSAITQDGLLAPGSTIELSPNSVTVLDRIRTEHTNEEHESEN
jgi:maltooligosyltrehalose trehalohydrolase